MEKEAKAMDKTKLVKLGLSALGIILTIGSTMVNDKVKSAELEETVSKKVAEALKNQAKES
jgi:hypothetical protein